MDAGDRWMLIDAAGKPMLAWDYNERQDDAGAFHQEHRLYATDYDALHRPVTQSIRIWSRPSGSGQDFTAQGRVQIERFDYQDAVSADTANLNAANAFLKTLEEPPSNVILLLTLGRDFSGNVQAVRRTLVSDATASVVDWSTPIAGNDARLEGVHYTQLTEHDALGRMTRLYNWHRPGRPVAVYEPRYNQRGGLASEEIVIGATKTADGYDRSTGTRARAIQAVTHDAKGQKLSLVLGNGTATTYTYDPKNFRLTSLLTTRPSRTQTLQSLHYTYDPAGNITHIRDDAQQTLWFSNQQVEPHCDYTYDALYRLIEATGRESDQHLGSPKSPEDSWHSVQVPTDHMLRTYSRPRSGRTGSGRGSRQIDDHHAAPQRPWPCPRHAA